MCGVWHHGNDTRWLEFNLTQGCDDLYISANETHLSIRGNIIARHQQNGSIQLDSTEGSLSPFCVLWEPLVDRLLVEVNRKNHTLLEAAGLKKHCCTDISPGPNVEDQTLYGIINGSMRTDVMSQRIRKAYRFHGAMINCGEFIFKFSDNIFSEVFKNLMSWALIQFDINMGRQAFLCTCAILFHK